MDAKTRQALRAGKVVVVSVDGAYVSEHGAMEEAMRATMASPERTLQILSLTRDQAERL